MSSLLIFLKNKTNKEVSYCECSASVVILEVKSNLSTSAFREARTSFSFWESVTNVNIN